MRSLEQMFRPDDFAFEESRESRMIVGQALNAQITGERGLCHVDIFDLDLHLVYLAIRLLGPLEFTARSEERGCGIG